MAEAEVEAKERDAYFSLTLVLTSAFL